MVDHGIAVGGRLLALTFLYNQRGHQVLRLVAVDPRTGQTRALIDERSDTFVNYSGKQYLEYINDPAGAGTSEEILWMSERDGWNHLYLYDQTGQVKNQVTRSSRPHL